MRRFYVVSMAMLLLLGAGAAFGQVAEVQNYGDALVFTPVTEYEQIIFTVTGPCNYYQRDVITKGDAIFRLDETTIDGRYRFQLVVIPSIDSGIIDLLKDARQSGNNSKVDQLCRDGKLPGDPLTQAAGFGIFRGEIVYDPDTVEKGLGDFDSGAMMADVDALSEAIQLSEAPDAPAGPFPTKDVVYADDLIVQRSLCVGFDCVNGEVFSFDTIRLKENNLRIKFEDTSGGSFPSRDWEIEANSSTNGGQSHFRVRDVDGPRDIFTLEAGAPSHSLYVDSSGRIGRKTSNPVLEAHLVDGDTPALRLEQDTSSGFGAQTWDIAGNETSFFIRDVTSGSTLPFRIRPGASSNSLVIDNDSDVGIGTLSPDSSLHVERTDSAQILVENTTLTSGTRILQHLRNEGTTVLRFENTAAPALGDVWDYQVANGGAFQISAEGSGAVEFLLTPSGDLTITGNLITGGGGLCDPGPCDGTFSPEYEVESIEEHAAFMWKNRHLWGVGPTPEGAPINLSKKTTGILHELEKAHIYIEQLHNAGQTKDERISELEQRLARLEALLPAASD